MKKTIILLFISFLIGLPVHAQPAAGGSDNNPTGNNPLPQYNLLEPLPCIPGGEVKCATPGATEATINFKYYVQYMFNLLIALAAVASVFMIVYGGLKYMSTDSWGDKKEGLKKVQDAVLGLLLVLTSYLILQVIDPRLVQIPTTLVPALNIRYENVSDKLLTSLENELNSFRASTAETKAAIQKIDALNADRNRYIAQVQADIDELRDLGFTNEDPEIATLLADIDSVKSEIKRDTVEAHLLVDKVAIDTQMLYFSPLSGTKAVNWQAASTELDRVYSARFDALLKAGAEGDQLQQLRTYKDYAKAVINMNAEVAKVVQIKLSYDNSFPKTSMYKRTAEEDLAKEKTRVTTLIADVSQKIVFNDDAVKALFLNKASEAKAIMAAVKIE